MLYEELFQISKVLLAAGDEERTPEILLRRIVERCGAETGSCVMVCEEAPTSKLMPARRTAGRFSSL
jgi:hypothetical protein